MVTTRLTPVPRSLRAVLAAALALAAGIQLAGPGAVGAQSRVHLPLLLRSGTVPVAPTRPPAATPLPLEHWSTVLAETPVYPGMVLAFFELRLAADPPAAVALYDPPAALPGRGAVLEWYRTVLAAHGWRLGTEGVAGSRWTRPGGHWLEARYDIGADGVLRLALRRDPDGARLPAGQALATELPLPPGAVRVRFDRADLLPEEVAVALTAAEARLAVERLLARAGWRETSVVALEAAMLLGFERGAHGALVSVRSVAPEAAEIGVGTTRCEPATVASPPGVPNRRSAFLADVMAPPEMRLAGYERDASVGTAAERWQGTCADLDLLLAGLVGRLVNSGWHLAPGALERLPSAATLALSPASGPPLEVEVRTLTDGAAEATFRRSDQARRRPTARASLLWPDVPLPPGSDAWHLATNTGDGWQWRETYRVPPAMAGTLSAWYRSEMMESRWQFDRLEPAGPGEGPGQVYFQDGEELWIEPQLGTVPAVRLARRRSCASAEPLAPPAQGQPARWLAELLVYPEAQLEGFEAPAERYRTRCAATGLIADWYRAMLERGNWALVSTVHPNDPARRRLTFARPWERTWPPERRTAWAEVQIERLWPYQHRFVLRRDPTGVLPRADAR